jgi:hypothetical protein
MNVKSNAAVESASDFRPTAVVCRMVATSYPCWIRWDRLSTCGSAILIDRPGSAGSEVCVNGPGGKLD